MQHFVFLHEESVLFLVLNISFKCQSYINKQEKNNLGRKEILNSLQPYLRSLPFESSEACGSHNRGDSHGKRNSYRPPTPTTHTHLTLDKMCGCVCVCLRPRMSLPHITFSLSASVYLLHCIPHTFLISPLAFKGVHGICH